VLSQSQRFGRTEAYVRRRLLRFLQAESDLTVGPAHGFRVRTTPVFSYDTRSARTVGERTLDHRVVASYREFASEAHVIAHHGNRNRTRFQVSVACSRWLPEQPHDQRYDQQTADKDHRELPLSWTEESK
jgi:hypothetical protein